MKNQVEKWLNRIPWLPDVKEWWLTFRYGKDTPIYYQTARVMGFNPLDNKDKK